MLNVVIVSSNKLIQHPVTGFPLELEGWTFEFEHSGEAPNGPFRNYTTLESGLTDVDVIPQ